MRSEKKWVKKDPHFIIKDKEHVTMAIVFHRINGAFFVLNTIMTLSDNKF